MKIYTLVRFILRLLSVIALVTIVPMMIIWAWTAWNWYDLQDEIDCVG